MTTIDTSKFDNCLKVKKAKAGRGLFTFSEIPKGTFLIEYCGKKLSESEKYASNSKYLFEINNKITLDGYIKDNNAKFINHSCRPNSEFVIKRDKVYIQSLRKIKPGEEITVDYGPEYFKEYIKPIGCICSKCSK